MKYLALLCLTIGLAGCYSAGPYASAAGPYASANDYSPVVDLGACASSAAQPTHVDQLCNRQNANPYGSN